MKIVQMVKDYMTKKKKIYRLELPIGLELSDGDRAAIYGWPDKYANEAGLQRE